MEKRVTAELKLHTFDPCNPVSIIEFLFSFKRAYDNSKIYGVAAMLPILFLMKTSASFAIHTLLAPRHKAGTRVASTKKTTKLTTCL